MILVLGSVLSWSWAPPTVSVPNLPTEVGAVQSCQASLARCQVLGRDLPWNSGKAEDGASQAGAGQEVLVASLAQRTGMACPSSGSKLFFQETLSKMQRLQGGWASVPGSKFPHPRGGRASVNEGPSQCRGGGDPQLPSSRLWPFKYVSGLGEEVSLPSAPSGSTRPPPRQQPEGGGR